RPSSQLLAWQCRLESGQESPPTTSLTSTTTSTVHRKRGEAGLRGHALLGCSTSSTRSVPRTGNPRPAGDGEVRTVTTDEVLTELLDNLTRRGLTHGSGRSSVRLQLAQGEPRQVMGHPAVG